MARALTLLLALALLLPGAALARPGDLGQFHKMCELSHQAADDPIVSPGVPGAAHMHSFFGNVTTNAFSTSSSIRAGGEKCTGVGDHSAYWVPSAYRLTGQPAVARWSVVYYRTAGRDPASIVPFPAGLRVIAGDGKAEGPQDPDILRWGCSYNSMRATNMAIEMRQRRWMKAIDRHRAAIRRLWTTRKLRPAQRRKAVRRHRRAALKLLGKASAVPRCSEQQELKATIRFPDCWDGRNLDSSDHQSHMEYARFSRRAQTSRCPESHPVPVPKLVMQVHYELYGAAPPFRLSSGPPHTMHADFFNGWDEAALRGRVERCLKADVRCST